MSELVRKHHNVSVLLYHFVCVAKYRRVIFDNDVIDRSLKNICIEIEDRYEIEFVEIGIEGDHAHFLVQSVPTMSPSALVQKVKSITARELFLRHPEIRKQLWGGELWTKGYFISTVGPHGDENLIRNYVKNQGSGKSYKQLHQRKLGI